MVPGLTSRELVDRIQYLVPTARGRDDAIGIGRPDKGLRAAIVLGEEPIDRESPAGMRTCRKRPPRRY